jgi:hypothetical protein
MTSLTARRPSGSCASRSGASAIAEAAGEYVWELDVDGRYTYVSAGGAGLGYAIDELLGRKPMT